MYPVRVVSPLPAPAFPFVCTYTYCDVHVRSSCGFKKRQNLLLHSHAYKYIQHALSTKLREMESLYIYMKWNFSNFSNYNFILLKHQIANILLATLWAMADAFFFQHHIRLKILAGDAASNRNYMESWLPESGI